MIDISSHIQKLEWLKEWIADRLDGKISPPIWVNMDAAPFNFTIQEVMEIWQECGIIVHSQRDVIYHPAIPISFNEYCTHKQDQLCQNQSL